MRTFQPAHPALHPLDRDQIVRWLLEDDPDALDALWREADAVRARNVGDAVPLRGIVEFSNVCVRQCAYCGIREGRRNIGRYRMTHGEILVCARRARKAGYGTLVLQSGEDPSVSTDWIADLVRRVKTDVDLAVTLAVGERRPEDYTAWKAAGADRYLLKFETSDAGLYARVHPARPDLPWKNRLEILQFLRSVGYEVGSGVMVGLPGQTFDHLAGDLLTFRELDLDMIGMGPFVPHPETPLAQTGEKAVDGQVPNDDRMTFKAIALTRLLCPSANLPATTALATLNPDQGYELGLQRGANVIMPNLTPMKYRRLYEIYPSRYCVRPTAGAALSIPERIRSLGRTVGTGPGVSRRFRERGLVPNG